MLKNFLQKAKNNRNNLSCLKFERVRKNLRLVFHSILNKRNKSPKDQYFLGLSFLKLLCGHVEWTYLTSEQKLCLHGHLRANNCLLNQWIEYLGKAQKLSSYSHQIFQFFKDSKTDIFIFMSFLSHNSPWVVLISLSIENSQTLFEIFKFFMARSQAQILILKQIGVKKNLFVERVEF